MAYAQRISDKKPSPSEPSQAAGHAHAPGSISNQAMLGIHNLNAEAGNPESLSEQMHKRLEKHFGYNLSSVQVRRSNEASKAGGKAMAQGNVINFSSIDERSSSGQKMIAHEVAHVIQQAEGRVSSLEHGTNISMDSGLEREADAQAESFVRGSSGGAAETSLAPLPAVNTASAPVQGWGFASLLHPFERGHDLIMPKGRQLANAAARNDPPDRSYSENDLYNLNIGNYVNDMGLGTTKRKAQGVKAGKQATPGALNAGLRNQAVFGVRFKFGKNNNSFVANTHKGKMQFLHGMKSTNDRDQLDTTEKIKGYADLSYGLGAHNSVADGNGRALTLDSRMSDLGNSRFSNLGFQNVSDFYSGDMKKYLTKNGRLENKIEKLTKPGKKISKRQQKKIDSLKAERTKNEGYINYMRKTASGAQMTEDDDRFKPKNLRKIDDKIASYTEKRDSAGSARKRDHYRKKVDNQVAKRQGETDSYKGMTMRQMVGVKEGDTPEGNRAAQMRYLGSLSHMAQDTQANSHAFRGFVQEEVAGDRNVDITNSESVLSKINPVLQHADFRAQDEKKHHTADVLAKTPTGGTNDSGRVAATAGGNQSAQVTAHILHAAGQKKSSEQMSEFFKKYFALDKSIEGSLSKTDAEINALPEGAEKDEIRMAKAFQVTGSGRAYRKKELSQSYKGNDKETKTALKNYTEQLNYTERGTGNKTAPTAQKTAPQRLDELRAQFRNLKAAEQQMRPDSNFEGDNNVYNEIHNDVFDIYKQMQGITGKMTEQQRGDNARYLTGADSMEEIGQMLKQASRRKLGIDQ